METMLLHVKEVAPFNKRVKIFCPEIGHVFTCLYLQVPTLNPPRRKTKHPTNQSTIKCGSQINVQGSFYDPNLMHFCIANHSKFTIHAHCLIPPIWIIQSPLMYYYLNTYTYLYMYVCILSLNVTHKNQKNAIPVPFLGFCCCKISLFSNPLLLIIPWIVPNSTAEGLALLLKEEP